MPYVAPCDLPNFRQSVPSEGTWRLVPNGDPRHQANLTWENAETGETVVVPHIWYNSRASAYAASLRYGAEISDENAKRQEQEGKPWSRMEADRMRRQSRRLRAMATLCDRNPDLPSSRIDFRGLSNPITPTDAEIAIVEAIERGE